MNSAAPTAPTRVFRKAGLRETTLLLAIAWLIPFAVHLAPWAGERPLGAYLLPMFWTAFVAVYFYGAAVGLLVGLFAPVINLFITGLPVSKFLTVLSFELVAFTLVAALVVRRWPRFFLAAPLGYLAAKTGATLLQSATTVFGDIGAPLTFFAKSVAGGLAGLAVLLAINAALMKFYPKTAAGHP